MAGVFSRIFGEKKPEETTLKQEFTACVQRGANTVTPGLENDMFLQRRTQEFQAERPKIEAACKVDPNSFKP